MSNPRKARARHLIQLGDILQKSGLADALGLKGDLQNTPEMAEPCALLAGALEYLKGHLNTLNPEQQKALRQRGMEILGQAPQK
jgi:hypothetical protein